jgi:hypothetical protein
MVSGQDVLSENYSAAGQSVWVQLNGTDSLKTFKIP